MTPLALRRRATDRAFERLYRTHVHAVYRYALAVLHNEADAEDVTQTTFLNAYRAFERGERPHTPHNWLIKIAHNVCRQRFRESARRPREVEFDDTHAPTTENADVPNADEIRRAVGFLAFNQRAALVMRELEGRSYAEIAQVLDISVSAVETLIFRARRALREQLEGGLNCEEAEQTLTRLQSRKLSSDERGALRAHLRECKDCATLERRQRAQRGTLERLGAVPLPASLASFFGGGATGGVAAGGFGLGAKAATVLAAGLLVTSVGHEPLKAGATDARARVAKQHGGAHPESSQSTSARTALQRTNNPRARRKGTHTKSDSASHTPAGEPGTPTPGPGAPGSGSQQSAGGPPPTSHPPPPIQLPDLPIQVPPIQLPPVPPVHLPPPPPLPPLPPPPPLPPLPPPPPLPLPLRH